MFFLASQGYRCIAADRRGHGRSSQPWQGNDMNAYADDLAELMESLDLKDAMLVGHSTGGGRSSRGKYLGSSDKFLPDPRHAHRLSRCILSDQGVLRDRYDRGLEKDRPPAPDSAWRGRPDRSHWQCPPLSQAHPQCYPEGVSRRSPRDHLD